jgi:hypothetical protein
MNKILSMSLLAAAVAVTGCSKKEEAAKTEGSKYGKYRRIGG